MDKKQESVIGILKKSQFSRSSILQLSGVVNHQTTSMSVTRDPKKAQDLLQVSSGASCSAKVVAGAASLALQLSRGDVRYTKVAMKRMAGELSKVTAAIDIVDKKVVSGAGQLGGTGASYAYKRFQVFEEQQRLTSTPVGAAQRTPLGDLTNFINTNTVTSDRPEARNSTKRRISLPEKTPKKKPDVVLPVPANGVKYLPEEAGKILVASSPGTCRQVTDEMIVQRYTDLSKQRLYAIKKRVEEGKAIKIKGRPCLASIPELKEFLSGATQGGNTVGTREITNFLVHSTSRKLVADGHSAAFVGVSAKSVRRYKDTALCLEEGRATTAALDKTEARYTAERSLMAAMTQAAVVAATGFIPTNNGVGSSSKLAKMVSKESGYVPVVPVTPLLTFSSDDTTVFAHVGAAASNEVRVASASEDGKTAGVFKMDDFSHLNGIRVRPTVTLTAAGHVAPLYVTVTGCSRREVTHPSGMFVVKVQGFCIAAASDHRANDVGYVVFLCSDNDDGESLEQKNFEFYRNEVLVPMVEDSREVLWPREGPRGSQKV